MRIFVDMDGTLAKWNNVEFEELFEEGYYRNLEPNMNILNEVNHLISQGEDVYILSAYLTESDYAKKEKQEWVNQYLPELPEEKQIFVPYGTNKAEYLKEHYSPITNTDYLIDDYTKNLLEWKEFGGIGVKYLNGINHTKGTWNGLMLTSYSNNETPFKLNLSHLIQIEKTLHYNANAKLPLIHFKKQYCELRYPTICNCKDFEQIYNELDTSTLDDIEYTIYLYEHTEAIEVKNEICFTKDYKFLEDNSRISICYLEWYEGMINTQDLINDCKSEEILYQIDDVNMNEPEI